MKLNQWPSRSSIFAQVLTAGLLLTGTTLSASAALIGDSSDTTWTAKPGDVTFDITHVSGSLAAAQELEFGLYDPDDLSLRPVFPPGYLLGDSVTLNDIGSDPFGFYLRNIGTSFGGPYVFYSNSALNPAGNDAMAADDLGGNMWEIEFEDAFLPLTPGSGDLRVKVTNIMPEVPEPSACAIWCIVGLLGAASQWQRIRKTR